MSWKRLARKYKCFIISEVFAGFFFHPPFIFLLAKLFNFNAISQPAFKIKLIYVYDFIAFQQFIIFKDKPTIIYLQNLIPFLFLYFVSQKAEENSSKQIGKNQTLNFTFPQILHIKLEHLSQEKLRKKTLHRLEIRLLKYQVWIIQFVQVRK